MILYELIKHERDHIGTYTKTHTHKDKRERGLEWKEGIERRCINNNFIYNCLVKFIF